MRVPTICRYCGGPVRLVPAELVFGASTKRLGQRNNNSDNQIVFQKITENDLVVSRNKIPNKVRRFPWNPSKSRIVPTRHKSARQDSNHIGRNLRFRSPHSSHNTRNTRKDCNSTCDSPSTYSSYLTVPLSFEKIASNLTYVNPISFPFQRLQIPIRHSQSWF